VDGDVAFALVDVSTDVALTGNPLAVVPDAAGLDEALLRALAREFNQSETTFLWPRAPSEHSGIGEGSQTD
jgi:trans-2,3-dihydro-3-hydroxyanthranilate isomerase